MKQFANMKYCTHQIGLATFFPRPFIIAYKSSPHFLSLKDSANKYDVGLKSELVIQSLEQSSDDFHLLIFYFNRNQYIQIYGCYELQFYSLSLFYSLYSECWDISRNLIKTGHKINTRVNFRNLSALSALLLWE